MGLAIFRVGHAGPRSPPRALALEAPLLQLPAVPVLEVDLPAAGLHGLLAALATLPDTIFRHPRRSLLSSDTYARVVVDVLFPPAMTELEALLYFRRLRRDLLTPDTYFGFRHLYTAPDAMILEFTQPTSLPHFWALSSQLIVLGGRKVLLFSDAAEATWTTAMDTVLLEDSPEAALKLRWKASRHGGRSVATPSATPTALAASRRQSQTAASQLDFRTEVIVQGEVGREDGEVLRQLMRHVAGAAQLELREAGQAQAPRPGEFVHASALDPSMPPGRLQLFLRSAEEVRRVYAALDGRLIQVGTDRIQVKVLNDAMEARGIPGGPGRRRR